MNATKAKESLLAARLSVLAKGLVVAVQIWGGLKVGSLAMLSEAAHSGVDLLAFFFVFLAIRTASRPADEGHPYGHGKAEHLSSAAEAVLILLAAGAVMAEAMRRLAQPNPLPEAGLGAALMAFTFAVSAVETSLLQRAGVKTDSPALKANSLHWMTDMASSGVVLFSLGALWLGRKIFPAPDLAFLEPCAALVVAILMGYTAYRLAWTSGGDLMDASLPKAERDWVAHYLGKLERPVHGFHDLKTRKAGSQRFLEFHLLMDPDLSVEKAHTINDEIEAAIEGHLPGCTIQIHVEPATRE